MNRWISALAELAETSTPAVLVTVLEAKGSTPREVGAKMVVTTDNFHGTIGGGHLELKVLETARALLAEHAGEPTKAVPPVVQRFPLGPSLGQCCGGEVAVLFEPVLPAAFHIALFGAGHVGQALIKLLADLPCRVTWIDPRADAFPSPLPSNVAVEVSDSPEVEVAELPAGSHVLVMTHSHALDLRIIEASLRREDFPYIGLIGSKTKRARFAKRLASRGITAAKIARLICPIGIPGVSGKRPAEIAVVVAAQLLQMREAAPKTAAGPSTLVDGITWVMDGRS